MDYTLSLSYSGWIGTKAYPSLTMPSFEDVRVGGLSTKEVKKLNEYNTQEAVKQKHTYTKRTKKEMKINDCSLSDTVVSISKALGVMDYESVSKLRSALSNHRTLRKLTIRRVRNRQNVLLEVVAGTRQLVEQVLPRHSGVIRMESWMSNNDYVGDPRKATQSVKACWENMSKDGNYSIEVEITRPEVSKTLWDLSVTTGGI